jgi:PAS domain S-box-containing protein
MGYTIEPTTIVMTIERHSALIDRSPIMQILSEGIAEWNIVADEYLYSDRYCRLLGYSPGTLERTHAAWLDRLFSEDRKLVVNVLREHLERRAPFEVECRVRAENDEYRWVRFRGQAEFNDQLAARYMVFSMSDINEAKQSKQEVHNSRIQLQNLTFRALERQESERKRIARELHDEIGQVLTAIKLNLQSAQRSAPETPAVQGLTTSIGMIDDLANQVRNLSRLLRPPQLDALGLASALAWYVDNRVRSSGLSAHFVCDPLLVRLQPELETNCFRIVQEALTNVLRYANAKSVAVELRRYEDSLRLNIKDDGDGFDVAKVRARTARGECLGLFGIEERARLLGGDVTFRSAPGQGTDIEVALPLLLAKPRSRMKPRSH